MKKKYTAKQKEHFRKMIIVYGIKKGYSSRKIQQQLKNKKLGIRRKTLLTKIRLIKNIEKRKSTMKYIPKKYRRETLFVPAYLKPQKPQREFMYRLSLAINDVPVHKKYVSFLLQAFSNDKSKLNEKINEFTNKLLELANSYLGYNTNILGEWNSFNYYIAKEYPTEVVIDTRVIGKWVFYAERDGVTCYHHEGDIDAI